jgi:hypothetical protein
MKTRLARTTVKGPRIELKITQSSVMAQVPKWKLKENSSEIQTFYLQFIHVNRLSCSRLVENIRLTDTTSSTGVLSKIWDFNIEEKDAEFRDDLREASGIGRKRRKVSMLLSSPYKPFSQRSIS